MGSRVPKGPAAPWGIVRLWGRLFAPKAQEQPAPAAAPAAVIPHRAYPPRPPAFTVGVATHPGLQRERNEDSFAIFQSTVPRQGDHISLGLFIVADGMGGHEGGKVASELAVREAAAIILNKFFVPTLGERGQAPVNEILGQAMMAANAAVWSRVQGKTMGTTLTAALLLGRGIYIAHIGDSRAYLIGKADMVQLTSDHSVVERLLSVGQLTKDEARKHPKRSVLYRAVGQAEAIQPDIYREELPKEERLLLCTDGLWEMLPDEEVARLVNAFPDPQEACDELIAAANSAGGEDNITAILVRLDD